MAMAFESLPKEFVSETSSFDYKDPLTLALAKINKYGAIILTKDKGYYGIVDDRSVSRKGSLNLPEAVSLSKFAKRVPLVNASTSIEKAIKYMYESDSKALAYAEDNKVLGVVKRDTILKTILSLHILSEYKAVDIMSTPVIAIDSSASLSQARSTMHTNKINRLVVTSKQGDSIITHKSVANYLMKTKNRGESVFERHSLPETKVSEISEKNVYTIDYKEPVDNAIREMIENKISSVPVTRKGRITGMITAKDILSAVLRSRLESASNIMMSGFSGNLLDYETEIKDELSKFNTKVNRFSGSKVGAIAFHIRGFRQRSYEMKMRIWLEKRGAISISASGYSIERVLKDILARAYTAIKFKKEIVYAAKKQGERPYEE
jgi:predicted transcriptional regulator